MSNEAHDSLGGLNAQLNLRRPSGGIASYLILMCHLDIRDSMPYSS